MDTAGGAMGGYCATGSVMRARLPASIRMMAMTQAKMGRSMKNLESMAYWGPPRLRRPRAVTSVGATAAPGMTFCRPLTMTRSPALSPSVTSHLSPMARSVRMLAQLHLVVRRDQKRARLPARIAHHALLRHEEAVFADAFLQMRRDEHAGQQECFRIGKHRAQNDRAGALVNGHLAELQRARLVVGRAILER